MEKYFYLFGGVIIGSFVTYYFKEKYDMNYEDMNYEDTNDEDVSDDECIHTHIVNSQESILCEPEVIKLKSM